MPKRLIIIAGLFIVAPVVTVILAALLPEILKWPWLGEKEGLSVLIRNLGLLLAGLFGVWLAWHRTRIAEQGHITDRYSKAVEQLGDRENISVRIGGLYALKRIALDSDTDHPTIPDVIANFIRHPPYDTFDVQIEKDEDEEEKAPEIILRDCPDIIVACQILQDIYKGGKQPNLQRAKLAGFDLEQVNLHGVNLTKANLRYSNLREANIQAAVLEGAN